MKISGISDIDRVIMDRLLTVISQGVSLKISEGMSKPDALVETLSVMARYVEAMQTVEPRGKLRRPEILPF